MARLETQLTNEMLEISSVENPLLVVVDMINGFVNEGALADKAVNDIIPCIVSILDKSIPSVFAVDEHDENAIEFKSFPVHCLKGSKESEIVDELKPYANDIVYKNSTNMAHAMDMNEFVNKADTFIITGCCTDICVMQFALTLRTYLNQHDLKKEVFIVCDGVETYHADGVHDAKEYNRMALQMMAQSGIKLVKGVL